MAKFTVDKKGYNIQEVDEYINKMYLKYEDKLAEQKDRVVALKNEVEALNERLSNYVNKDEQISKALIFAVEKAEQIENNAKNVYNLEIKRVNALYSRFEDLLLEIEKEYPKINKNGYLNSLMEDFKANIDEVSKTGLTLNTKTIKGQLKQNSDQFIKNILNKMDYVVNSVPVQVVEEKPKAKKEKLEKPEKVEKPEKLEKPEKVEKSEKSEKIATQKASKVEIKKPETTQSKFETPVAPLKPEVAKQEVKEAVQPNKSYSTITSINERLQRLNLISKNTNLKTKKNESLAEKYLNSDEDVKLNAYSKNFAKRKLEKTNSPFDFMQYPEPNESGFDLKDALNPKEDLDEIMKAFDFFDGDKK